MGYYVTLDNSDVMIPTDNIDAAFEAVKELNGCNQLKRGGRYGGVATPKPEGSKSLGTPDKWFAWMEWNYDETCESLAEVLEMIGFEVETNEHGIFITWYDSKSGDEEVFFKALAPFIEDGGMMEWSGEEGCKWAWKFSDGEMLVGSGTVHYDFD